METWTEEEDQALMVAVGRGKRPAWKSIARDILGKKRSRHACRNRYRYLLARTQQRKKKGKKEGGPGELSPLDVGDSDSELTDSAARLLLEAGTDPTIENDEGMNALQITQVRQSRPARLAPALAGRFSCHSRRSVRTH